ncbi:MAG: peptide chain release factor N(5)-glutamine methyltransferase [Bacteroides sp.]|nr:peptide chain release factor N(5)-glutamine methyltransferase [Bacteroides sp.]
MTSLRQLMDKSREKLAPIYGDGEARWMLRIIMEHIKGWDAVELAMRADKEVSDFTISRVNDAVKRLSEGEPIQYIYGDTYWYGMTLKVTPDVLIPRPETEELVDIIVKENKNSDLRVLDVCTGSGCVAIALAKSLNFPSVTATDISEAALNVARQNADLQKVHIRFLNVDALHPGSVSGKYDIIVSNPPYVMEHEKSSMDKNVLDHEPHLALFVPDTDPLKFYKSIAATAVDALSENGTMYFELNPLTADDLAYWMRSQGWNDIRLLPDIHTKTRFMIAKR